MSDRFLHKIPFVEPTKQGRRQCPSMILIKPSWTTGDKGAANAIAQTWHNSNAGIESCHFIVDVSQTIRCVSLSRMAVSSSPIVKGSISICCCYNPPEQPDEATLFRTAKLVAQLCRRYRFPIEAIEPGNRRRWFEQPFKRGGGIVFDVPGNFPTSDFLVLVHQERKLL